MCRRLCHVPGVARGACPAHFAGESDQEVVPAVSTAGTREPVRQDAAFEVAAKLPLHVLRHTAAIIAPLAGKRRVRLQMRLHRVVQWRALGAATEIDGAPARRVDGSVHAVGQGRMQGVRQVRPKYWISVQLRKNGYGIDKNGMGGDGIWRLLRRSTSVSGPGHAADADAVIAAE